MLNAPDLCVERKMKQHVYPAVNLPSSWHISSDDLKGCDSFKAITLSITAITHQSRDRGQHTCCLAIKCVPKVSLSGLINWQLVLCSYTGALGYLSQQIPTKLPKRTLYYKLHGVYTV